MTDKTNLQNKDWERIPHIWYCRPIDDTYTIEKANISLPAAIRQYPDLLTKYAIGGYTNGVNTHLSVSTEELTNGTYTPKSAGWKQFVVSWTYWWIIAVQSGSRVTMSTTIQQP